MTGLTVHIPTLETERLILRAPMPEDFEAFAVFQASERAIARGWFMDRAEAHNHWCQRLGEWIMLGFGWFMMERKSDKAAIGYCGLMHPVGQPEPELGWTIWSDEAEGKGYAFEAATRVAAHVFQTLKWPALVSYIHPDNARSIALAERLAAVRDGTWMTPSGKEVLVYRHTPEVAA